MKKELYQEIEIPEGVEAEIEGTMLKVKGPMGENSREFKIRNLDLKKEGNKIIVGNKKSTKNEKKLMNTLTSHIRNMLKGVQEKFEYQLKVCFSHFPINIEIKDQEAIIKNFLGEKIPRKVKLTKGAEVKLDKDIITVSSVDKELAGQVAANFEAMTKVGKKDRRVFQDGIFMISKAGREL
jgi:large subunit ribosomal protein L6